MGGQLASRQPMSGSKPSGVVGVDVGGWGEGYGAGERCGMEGEVWSLSTNFSG